jgi:hypothetical protein
LNVAALCSLARLTRKQTATGVIEHRSIRKRRLDGQSLDRSVQISFGNIFSGDTSDIERPKKTYQRFTTISNIVDADGTSESAFRCLPGRHNAGAKLHRNRSR